LLRMSDLSDEDRDGAERIIGAGRHLLVLINELIDIARIESGEISLSLEPVPVVALIEEVSQLIGPLAAERSITITGDCQRPGLAARADRQRVSQVLLNLASNAVKYCYRGGTITFSCRQDAEYASVVVSDTGPGLAQADLERIFVPFERLGAEQAGIEGTGIGLPLSRTLTEAMGGQLRAASVLGEGSAFTISLPRAPDLTPVPPADPVMALPAGPRSPAQTALSILYIEDHPANIEVITRLLRRRPNTKLLSATSGREGIQSAIHAVPDLILLDLDLPDIPGEQVLRELHAAPSTAAIPVVILSADAAPGVIRRILAAGVFAYLTKPVDLVQLSVLLDSFAAPARQPHPHNDAVTRSPRAMPGVPSAPSLSAGSAGPANRVVLYIEDDQSNATLVAKLLTRRPHTKLHIATTARDGIQAAIDRQPALILLDNRLPDATGAETLRKLASAQLTASIPVIIISGDSGIGASGELRAAGAVGFLAKPYDIHQFLAIIDRYLP
jgi:CheY-like chemotaxis protein